MTDERIRQPLDEYFSHLRHRLASAFDELDTGIPAHSLADLAIATVQGGYVIARSTGDANAVKNATAALLALIERPRNEKP